MTKTLEHSSTLRESQAPKHTQGRYSKGDRVTTSGYLGTFVRYYSEGMAEIMLESGLVCVPVGDVREELRRYHVAFRDAALDEHGNMVSHSQYAELQAECIRLSALNGELTKALEAFAVRAEDEFHLTFKAEIKLARSVLGKTNG